MKQPSDMPRHIAILQGHPDPAGGHLCHALADAYANGASDAGHSVSRIEVAGLDFPLLRRKEEFERGSAPPAVREAQDAIRQADNLLIVYPLWHGTMPALLKGFIEQVFRPDFALEYREGNWPVKLLAGRSARIVITMGMPAMVYRWFYLAHSLRSLERNVLRFSGIKPVRESPFGMVDAVDDTKRLRWLAKMRKLGAAGQ